MDLKPYQQEVITDIELFLEDVQEFKNAPDAFHDFWTMHAKTPLQPFPGMTIEPYKDNVPKVPHVCVKVPTAGGKTFIACNALKTIFDAFKYTNKKAVVWLVPSTMILDQTIKQLKDNQHPYRQKINAHFSNRVEVYDKQTLLQGGNFNATSIQGQLSIFVLSIDSLRTANKEGRKVYQENSNLQSFETLVGTNETISLMHVIRSLNPVLIVDESHNAETELSVQLLNDLNPCFILDLTATPRRNSNIISFVDSMALKKENMVKLPVIVYNYYDKTEVINSALQFRHKLELLALEEEKQNGKYIRPIVLFQAQAKNAKDTVTFQKIKEMLIGANIPEEEIKIKTGTINEIKGIDLMARDCPVRYIITVDALKEGWDCPFAYILASLADKSSAVEVEQVLGRILRQPYVMQHQSGMLNVCYVLTASAKFLDTLDNIVKALNKAGFSSKDFRANDFYEVLDEAGEEHQKLLLSQPQPVLVEAEDSPLDDVDPERLILASEFESEGILSSQLGRIALQALDEYEEALLSSAIPGTIDLPSPLQTMVNVYPLKKIFEEQAAQISLPQFYIRKPSGELFGSEEQMLFKEDLLAGFQLSKYDSNLVFDGVTSNLYKVDLDETKRDFAPSFLRIDGEERDALLGYLIDPVNKDYRVKNFTAMVMSLMAPIATIEEHEIKKYIYKIIEDFTDEQYYDFYNFKYSYVQKIRNKIMSLADVYAEKQFRNYLDTDKVFMKAIYHLQKEIAPGPSSKDIIKSLYEKEAHLNGFEERVINEIANLPNVVFWTKNVEKKQFKINGFINHYPDFIIQTQRKTILLETKGDDRDNSDSDAKIQLGKAWEQKAGNNFKYFMVFDKKEVPGAHTLVDFLKLLKEM